MKKPGYDRQSFDPPYPVTHSIDGQKMPPDGIAQPLPDDRDPPHMASRPIGNAAPAGQDFGPYIDYLGEGLFHSFKLDFTNQIPYSTGGIHPHTGLLLFSLALNLRPDVIVETGTFFGYSTFFLAKACEIWGQGKVYTMDPNQTIITEQIKNNPWVECIPAKSPLGLETLLCRLGQVDMAFLDSWKRLSLWEFAVIDPYIVEGGMVVFHDTQLFDTGRALYDIVQAEFPHYDKMFFAGIPSVDNPHRYYGNADDRGLYVLRKRQEDPFLDVADADSAYFGKNMVVPQMHYIPVQVRVTEANTLGGQEEISKPEIISEGSVPDSRPQTIDVSGEGIYLHCVGDAKCKEGWCGNGFPFACKCGGLIHADLADEDWDSISLHKKCDKCGNRYEEVEDAI